MKRTTQNFLILLSPFLIMVITNEIIRPTIKETPYQYQNISTINSAKQLLTKCTWNCHHSTSYCKENHVKISQTYIDIIDPIYFGTIRLLKFSGNYRLANILIFVLFFPLVLFYLFLKILAMQSQIEELKETQQ